MDKVEVKYIMREYFSKDYTELLRSKCMEPDGERLWCRIGIKAKSSPTGGYNWFRSSGRGTGRRLEYSETYKNREVSKEEVAMILFSAKG